MHDAARDLADAVAVITGAASGIGRACAQRFAGRGAKVVAVDRNWPRPACEALPTALIVQADVSRERQVAEVMTQVRDAFGAVDMLVNCAGIIRRASVVETSARTWDDIMGANLRSVFLMSRAVLSMMLPRGRGCIVNVASGWGLAGGTRAAAYCASKAGVVMLTRAMALDHGRDGVRVNCICPGDTDTPMLRQEAVELGLPPDALLQAARSRPLGRAGSAQDMADAVLFLASPSASFVTGAVLVVDGGGLAGAA